MRERMRWDTLYQSKRLRLVTYSTFLGDGCYKVRAMLGTANPDGTDKLSPSSKPYKVFERIYAKSHDNAFEKVFKWIRQEISEMRGYKI